MTSPSRGSYPHPVLDDSDDVASYFEVSNVGVSPSFEDIELTFDARTNDPTLGGLLDSGRARYSLRWRCSATLATEELEPSVRMVIANGHQFEVWLDQRQVRGSVVADIRVLAVEPLQGFRWHRQHSDYGDATFDLRIGDVLADGGSFTFEASKLYDPLNPPIGSCFKFVKDKRVRRGIKVTFDDDEVVLVRLSSAAHRHLGMLTSSPELQISAVVLPALMEAISFIRDAKSDEPGEDLSDRAWYRPISDAVERHGGFDERVVEVAQRILDNPIERTLALLVDADEEEE